MEQSQVKEKMTKNLKAYTTPLTADLSNCTAYFSCSLTLPDGRRDGGRPHPALARQGIGRLAPLPLVDLLVRGQVDPEGEALSADGAFVRLLSRVQLAVQSETRGAK